MPVNNKQNGSGSGILKKLKLIRHEYRHHAVWCIIYLYAVQYDSLSASSNIESYLVIAEILSRNETYTGLAIREETVHKAEPAVMLIIMPVKVPRSMQTV